MIRKATIRDVKEIHHLLKKYADRGELLPRALSNLYDDVRDFSVFEEESTGSILGICALHVCWEDLAEIRSLAVCEKHQREGIGSALVTAALAEADDLGIRRVFTLTYRPDFFNRHGFQIIDKAMLPQKVWAECIKCVKFPDCDEIAMLKLLSEG
ncbi:MAG: N-acetyltransferase [Deltaproteobacteria bacterium]|nr:N-acetyltransferase [Deltaproteobacteria bacterium]MBW2074320.1 N-acetyltransferase [Deltaproteobacteria bacterium]